MMLHLHLKNLLIVEVFVQLHEVYKGVFVCEYSTDTRNTAETDPYSYVKAANYISVLNI